MGDAGADPRRILIIGGGASGVLMAAQLLRHPGGGLEVALIERREILGCGVAYSTTDPSHLLNTRVSNMSAFPDDPGHFLHWLETTGEAAPDALGFVSRGLYGRYLADVLTPWRQPGGRLRCLRGECLRLEEPAGGGVRAHLADGRVAEGDIAILATGHSLPGTARDDVLHQPWGGTPIGDAQGRVLIIGSGLTMVDQVLSLLASGHRGEIVALSRRGLLPQPHELTTPIVIAPEDLPLGQGAAGMMRWLRQRVRQHQAAGGDWRDVVDGIRPHMQRLWRDLPVASRRSFLRHACAWWEVHRHRMPPDTYQAVQGALARGQLTLLRGAYRDAWRDDGGQVYARVHKRGVPGALDLAVARIIDCRGIRRDPQAHATPLIANLLLTGRGRIDPLRLGLDIGPGCAVLGSDGQPSSRIFAIGPASRAAFWEITAIPDIREQVAQLARALTPA